MTDDLRTLLGRAVDHAVAYRGSLPANAGKPKASYGELLRRFTEPLPDAGMPAAAVLDQMVERSADGLMPITGPRFFAWVMGSSHPAGVAADWVMSAWGQNTAFPSPTPATTAMEQVAEAWLLEILDLPRDSSIGFVTGATVAGAVGLAAARTRVLLDRGWDPDADGLFGAPPVTVYIGADAHSSMFSALQLIGFGYRRVVTVETDVQGRMQPAALAAAMAGETGAAIVIAQAGQINTGAFDAFREIAEIAKSHGAWIHVDGAFGLWARATPGYRQLTDGIELADSWVTDGHKWLQVPYDCGFAIVRDREAHQRAMTQWASYLPTMNPGERSPSAFVPELSRRARGTPVWAMLKTLGRSGVAEIVERCCRLTREMAARLAAEPGIALRNEVVLNQAVFSFGEGDVARRKALTEAVIARVQEGGQCFVGGASWHGDWVMRLSLSSSVTTVADVEISADAIIAAWREVRAASG